MKHGVILLFVLLTLPGCLRGKQVASNVQPPTDDLLYDETGMCPQKAHAFVVSDGYAMGWDGCRWHHGKSVHYVAYVNGPYRGTAYAVHKETETQKLYILRDGLKVYLLFH
ncbi:MAG: hypothetical protein OXI43_12345 [Candidatus Poribacteria bacterium]|nr:hypothetical protein [Candidatus Poribacteria bacterium]